MIMRLEQAEAEKHICELDDCPPFTRMGVWINQFDNGMGAGILRLTSPETGESRYLHYE